MLQKINAQKNATHAQEERTEGTKIEDQANIQGRQREIYGSWWLMPGTEFVVVPHANCGSSAVQFVLRVYTNITEGIILE